MSVSLYDLLDVDRDATADEIRAAWKAAIADLDPSDRRFRAYNQAAEVLLDPERRAAYDAELAAAGARAGAGGRGSRRGAAGPRDRHRDRIRTATAPEAAAPGRSGGWSPRSGC